MKFRLCPVPSPYLLLSASAALSANPDSYLLPLRFPPLWILTAPLLFWPQASPLRVLVGSSFLKYIAVAFHAHFKLRHFKKKKFKFTYEIQNVNPAFDTCSSELRIM